jgi:peptidoglycan/xylan/chitin deacetylase (PgdA/CDA1 family)
MIYAQRLLVVLCSFLTAPVLFAQAPPRQIAITIDDLPSNSVGLNGKDTYALNAKLVATLKQNQVPTVGFVNEKKLYVRNEVDQRIDALRVWLDAGLELGNHTFSHMSLSQATLTDWKDDVIRGESVTTMLMAEHKMKLRYLRHPYLAVGRDIETRRAAEQFLVQRGYRIAPITMDAWDWMYTVGYDIARRNADTAQQQKLVSSYLDYTNQVFDYNEKLSKQLLGYEPKQILLLHCNWLEADHIGDLLETLRKRGYKFISLEDALSDEAYSVPDNFVGEDGTGWIDHWAVTRGMPPQQAPAFPQWVIDLSKGIPRMEQPPL